MKIERRQLTKKELASVTSSRPGVRPCRVCQHPERREVEGWIGAGISVREHVRKILAA